MKINPADHAQRLTTTLNLLKQAGAYSSRYAHLVKALGGTKFDHDKPINLLTILEINGTEDCLWALCATVENCDVVAHLMAADFAEAVVNVYEGKYPDDNRPRLAIEATRQFALGNIGAAAWAAAVAAAVAAAEAAAEATAEAAAEAAAEATAEAAAWASAGAATVAAAVAAAVASAGAAAGGAAGAATVAAAWAAGVAAARAAQTKIIKRYLLP